MRPSVILSALGMVLVATGGVQFAAQQPAIPVQVVKISSGPSGSEINGNFVLTSERSVFNRNDDREIIVLWMQRENWSRPSIATSFPCVTRRSAFS